ncbi:MAG: FHA domain-containing protein [Verrucomicrobiota bacterium]
MPRVTITAPNKTPQPYRFQLERQVVLIGRGSENDIAVDCSSMSVRHAEMLRVEGGYKLRDHGSTNGIKLDGRRCEEIVLRDGLSVKLGDVAFDFELSEEERDTLAREKVLDDGLVFKGESKSVADGEQAEPQAEPKKKSGAAAGGGHGFMIFVGLMLFALLAFFGGLSLRHYMQTGGSLLGAIQAKTKTLQANRAAQTPPAPAPESPAPTIPVVPPAPAPTESAPPVAPVPETPVPGQ